MPWIDFMMSLLGTRPNPIRIYMYVLQMSVHEWSVMTSMLREDDYSNQKLNNQHTYVVIVLR